MGLNPTCSALPSSLSWFSLPVAILCSVSFHPALKEQMEEISTFSRTQKSNLHLQRWSAHPTYCTCTLSCNLMLSQLIFRPSCHDDATEMRVFQAILERLAEFIAYTLPLGQLFRCCLCGCMERKKSSVGVWETWLCLSPVSFGRSHCSQQCSPALLRVRCAQRLGLHTSRLPPAAASFLDPISVTLMCVYCIYL